MLHRLHDHCRDRERLPSDWRRGAPGVLVATVFLILVAGSAIAAAAVPSGDRPENPRPRIGLVLSGGGARGFAHLSTMKMLDSLGVHVDCVAGTSMGGILAALYAVGYSGTEIERLALQTDWLSLFSDTPTRESLPYVERRESGRYPIEFGLQGFKPTTPSGLIFGQNLAMFFADLVFPFATIRDFDALPTRFACVAINLVNGEEVVLREGSLARAMRATMAIPTVFSPVAWGDSLLIDGGTSNNLPVDVARRMGADLTIAIDVSRERKRGQLNNALVVLGQWLSMADRPRRLANWRDTDILIDPEVDEFTMADFSEHRVRAIIAAGTAAAQRKLPELLALLAQHGYSPPAVSAAGDGEPLSGAAVSAAVDACRGEPQLVLGAVSVSGNERLPADFILGQLDLHRGEALTAGALHRRIRHLYGLGYFEKVEYDLVPTAATAGDSGGGGAGAGAPAGQPVAASPAVIATVDLRLTVNELPPQKIRFGLRYDDIHKLVAAANVQSTNRGLAGLRLEGELQFIGLRRLSGRAYYPSRALNLPLYPFVSLGTKDVPRDLYATDGLVAARYNDRASTIAAGLGITPVRWCNLEIAYRRESTNSEISAGSHEQFGFIETEDELRQIRATFQIDTLDDVVLPRAGTRVRASYEEGTPDLDSDLAYRVTEVAVDRYRSVGRHTIRAHFYHGRVWDAPVYKFLDRGRPDRFIGLEYHQLFGSRITIARLDYRLRLTDLAHLKVMGNLAPEFTFRLDDEPVEATAVWGAGVGIKFVTLLGPFEVLVSHGHLDFPDSRLRQFHVNFLFGASF